MTGLNPNCDRLLRAGDGEERQSHRVEQKHGTAQPVDAGIREEGDEPGQDRNQQISPIGQGGRRHRADQQIAANPAKISGHEGQDEDAENVEPAIDRGNRPADRENEGAPQVKNMHEGFNGDHDGSARESLMHRAESKRYGISPIR